MNIIEKSNTLFYVFIGLTLAASSTNFIAFVSPYWIQSVPTTHSQFVRIGLWTACFNGYMRPDDFSKAYFGCYYIYYVEYDPIRDWINPIWLYAIQAFLSGGILFQSLVTFVVLCQATGSVDQNDMRVLKFNLIGQFCTCFSLAASLVAFAVARYDSTWMPFPPRNVLSWAYAVAAVSLALTFTAFVIGFVRYMYLEAMQDMSIVDPLLQGFLDVDGLSSPPIKEQDKFNTLMNYEEDGDQESQFDSNYPPPAVPEVPRPRYYPSEKA